MLNYETKAPFEGDLFKKQEFTCAPYRYIFIAEAVLQLYDSSHEMIFNLYLVPPFMNTGKLLVAFYSHPRIFLQSSFSPTLRSQTSSASKQDFSLVSFPFT